MKNSIVGIIASNESTYIQECILHNHIIGFNKIIIGLHNCTDNTWEKIKPLMDYIDIEVFDVKVNEETTQQFDRVFPAIVHQQVGYQNIYTRWKNRAEWIAFFDVDECLFISDNRKINSILNDIPDDVGGLCIPWLTFNHNNRIISVPQNHTRYSWFNNITKNNIDHGWNLPQDVYQFCQCKQIVRLDNIQHTKRWYRCHAMLHTGRVVDSDLRDLGSDTTPMAMHGIPAWERNVVLAHYRSGAMEDWVARWKRRHWTYNFSRKNNPYTYYDGTEWNKYTLDCIDNRMMQYHDQMQQLKKKYL